MAGFGGNVPSSSCNRGQTAFDFLVGMTVFLVAITFVFGFVPGMFQPFETDTGSDMVAAVRGAAFLTESALVDDVDSPGVVNESCAAEFFDGDGATGGCNFEVDATNLNEALAIDDSDGANVTIEDAVGITTVQGDGGPVAASAGRDPPSTADVVVATRVVLLDGDRRTLYVRVW